MMKPATLGVSPWLREEPQGAEGRSTVMAARDPHELKRIIKTVEDWRNLSDNMFQVGGLKVGLDGLLTWFPGVGDVYGLGASGFLLYQAQKAGASNGALIKMAMLLGTDAVVGAVPVAGDIFDLFFRAHARSSRILLKELRRAPELKALNAPPHEMAPRSEPPPKPARAPEPVPRPEPPLHSEEDEWEQARRVETLRAEFRDHGGSIRRPRP